MYNNGPMIIIILTFGALQHRMRDHIDNRETLRRLFGNNTGNPLLKHV